ncbi:hypothetical protein SALBM311S_05782 [Streptomyces alboniger]
MKYGAGVPVSAYSFRRVNMPAQPIVGGRRDPGPIDRK